MAGYHNLTQRSLVGGSRNAICIQNWVEKHSIHQEVELLMFYDVFWLGGHPVWVVAR